ncbi:MAG: ferric reductase-like transmembrane domain-containing protein [Planctomycetes bacterium]|nr:ferric reductase-like transmembrane domain-containing protein [Planctomycetota bacterium]
MSPTDPTQAPAAQPAHRRPRTSWAAAFWLLAYLLAVDAPLFALLVEAHGPGFGFAWDLAMALGYAGLAMLGIQFVLTARFRRATAPFGIDIVYHFHRYLAIGALGIAVAHYAILRVDVPAVLGSAWPGQAPAHMTAGRLSLLLFAAVVLLSLLRRALRLDYDRWRLTHSLLSTAAFALALWHVFGSGRYLDTPWKQSLWYGYGAIWLLILGYVRLWRPWRLRQRPYRVTALRDEGGDVWTLTLAPVAGRALAFAPGQFVWLTLGSSPFAMREHPFSIASSAERRDAIELSIKELGDFTATIKHVAVGATAYVDGPYGNFGIDHQPGAAGFVFLAGGIGIAPMLGMLRTMADRGDRRPAVLFHANRALDRTVFRADLAQLATRLRLRVVHLLEEPPPGWDGETGRLRPEVLAGHLPKELAGWVCFVCGPTPMVEAAERALAGLGVPATRIHAELFDWV